MADYWRVEREWAGETAFVICGGPSVAAQLPLLPRLHARPHRRVAVVNSSYLTYPNADLLFFADKRWAIEHYNKPEFQAFGGIIATVSNIYPNDKSFRRLFRVVPNTRKDGTPEGPGFVPDTRSVVSNRTSTQGLLNLIGHLGAARIVLLGLDMGRDGKGRTHHHLAHPWKNKAGNKTWDVQILQLQLIVAPLRERGIEVINTSLDSRFEYWPKMPLAEVLDRLDRETEYAPLHSAPLPCAP